MNRVKNIFLRYIIVILLAFPNFFIFYLIFTPLTIYPLFLLFKIYFSDVVLLNSSFKIFNQFLINIIPACVAGSAYYLLFFINLSIPKISFKKRFKMILFSFSFLLILNIIRIFILTLIFVSKNSSFESIHKLFWYAGATFFVVLIWFVEIKLFKIKEIPVYSDLNYLIKKIKRN